MAVRRTLQNRPFPGCLQPLFQSETNFKAFHMKMRFRSLANKTRFHLKGFALDLALKLRQMTTRKWPILGDGGGPLDDLASHPGEASSTASCFMLQKREFCAGRATPFSRKMVISETNKLRLNESDSLQCNLSLDWDPNPCQFAIPLQTVYHWTTTIVKRVETLLTFEANFRHLDNYNVYPPYPPPISVVCISDQIENLGEQHWKGGGGSKCQWPVSFVNQDAFSTK